MSIRKQHLKKLQPVITAISTTLQLTPKETLAQEQVNSSIIEELLQTNVIAKIQSISALKLIIYQLILIFYQQNNKKIEHNQQNPTSRNRKTNVLVAIKQILSQLVQEHSDSQHILNEKRNQKLNINTEKTFRNKFKIFTSYFNQYCTLLDQNNGKQSYHPSSYSSLSQVKQETLISQLETLVFKKDEQLKMAKEESNISQLKMQRLQQNLKDLQSDFKILIDQNRKINFDNQNLQIKLQQYQQLISEMPTQKSFDEKTTQKYIWNSQLSRNTNSLQNRNSIEQHITNTYEQLQYKQSQYIQLLLSQAITIEALIT